MRRNKALVLVVLGMVVVVAGGCTSAGLPGGGEGVEQLDKAYQTEITAALADAARAQEDYVGTHGAYATDISQLVAEYGLNVPDDMTVTVVTANATSFCVEATHEEADEAWHVSSASPVATSGGC